MKKTFRIIALLTISALYCFAVSLYSSNGLGADSAFSKLTGAQSKHSSSLQLSNLLCTPAQATISITAFQNTPPPPHKNPFNEFSAWVKTAEHLFFSTFSQYSFYSKNVLVRLQRTDLIFPFHYFW
ncbi:hypothetical protein [Runella sp.]|uniref:hypothetical protein n=1 Tax=Runella sp. TaxID=1960881 RepID=UPI003D0DAE94